MAKILSMFEYIKRNIYWELYDDEDFDFMAEDELVDLADTLARFEMRLSYEKNKKHKK